MCLEEYPECVIVGVEAEDSNDVPSTQVNISNLKYECTVFYSESSPNDYTWANDPSMILYKLERDEVDAKCPLAVDVFP
nr:unnamed protein product [Haemonchus contortus]